MISGINRSSLDLMQSYNLPVMAGHQELSSNRYRQFCSTAGVDLPSQYLCGEQEIDAAVYQAKCAHEDGYWRKQSREKTKSVLLRWADLLESSADTLSWLCAAQTGRSLLDVREHSLPKSISALRWFAELIDKTENRAITDSQQISYLGIIQREAIGCVGVILPWNDPMVTFLWKVAPALACGNSVIVKSSEYAHHAIVMAVRLGHQAGIPEAQLQLLTGGKEAGAALVTHPEIDAISFTGSSSTGKWIASEASKHRLKRVTLECGGKSPFLVSNHCRKLAEAAACLARNVFYNQGQICSAPTRAYIHQEVFSEFVELLREHALTWCPSHPLNGPAAVGHMIQVNAVRRVNRAITEASCRGLTPILSGSVKEPEYSIHPTIFMNVPEGDLLSKLELFGPVLIVNSVDNLETAIRRANDTVYGLAAAIWSDDINEAVSVASRLASGTVHVNSYGEDGNQIPFGGIKDSGQGKEKSIDTLGSYSTTKSICIRLDDRAPS